MSEMCKWAKRVIALFCIFVLILQYIAPAQKCLDNFAVLRLGEFSETNAYIRIVCVRVYTCTARVNIACAYTSHARSDGEYFFTQRLSSVLAVGVIAFVVLDVSTRVYWLIAAI